MSTTEPESLTKLLDDQRSAFLREGPPTLAQRREHLDQLARSILGHRDKLAAAISEDFGHRSQQETWSLELMPVVHGIRHIQSHLKKWMRPERRHVETTFWLGSNRVIYQPLGVIGIISPWNYPVALALMPLATALAAGNRAMMKPSELTPATSALMDKMLREIFAEDRVAVVAGDATLAAVFSSLPFDHLLFTGSTAVGRKIMRSASENLVPVTLELGGKSPAIIGRGSSLKRAAHSIAWGKLANAGQTCIAPDYVLVAEEELEDFISHFLSEVADLYPEIATNPDYTTIINDHHYQRLAGLLDDARAKGARIRETGGTSAGRTHPRTFLPVVVSCLTDEMAVAREEIFGPILPVMPYRTIEDAIDYINARPRPLALYHFGSNDHDRRQVMERTTSGGVAFDDTLLHYAQDDLPFGGVGASGMGAYHGHDGFKTLSHAKGVFEQSTVNGMDLIRPPFGKWFDVAMKWLLR
ncbi:MAG: coniferyl aldehyde dehydrogenase [Verrucomicrobiota bacterium]